MTIGYGWIFRTVTANHSDRTGGNVSMWAQISQGTSWRRSQPLDKTTDKSHVAGQRHRKGAGGEGVQFFLPFLNKVLGKTQETSATKILKKNPVKKNPPTPLLISVDTSK